jgi:diketogulonate reductase-like aldo/keto reductase
MTLIDTAEMYADGGAEELVGAAIAGQRDRVFLVSKVLPNNASPARAAHACERSLQRLGTDHIDLYLLHWRGPVALADTVEAFTDLVDRGLVRHWGVSNFDAADLIELTTLADGRMVEIDEVLYNPARRGIELDLWPMCENAGLPLMAYSPFDHGALLRHPALGQVAARHGASPAQVVLAWVIRRDGIATIPKATSAEHARDNHGALDVQLTAEDYADLDRAFPPPPSPRPLEMG